jgi:hypothetical protein
VSPILGHLDSDIFPDAGIFFPKRFAPPKKKYALGSVSDRADEAHRQSG